MVHVPLMFLSEWHEFPSTPCLAGIKKLDSWRLDIVEIARVAWHAYFQPLQQEKTCNSAHEQTPLSNDIINSFLRHREVCRAKDLSAPPRNFAINSTSNFGIFNLNPSKFIYNIHSLKNLSVILQILRQKIKFFCHQKQNRMWYKRNYYTNWEWFSHGGNYEHYS